MISGTVFRPQAKCAGVRLAGKGVRNSFKTFRTFKLFKTPFFSFLFRFPTLCEEP